MGPQKKPQNPPLPIPYGDKENRPHEGKSPTATSTQQANVSTDLQAKFNEPL